MSMRDPEFGGVEMTDDEFLRGAEAAGHFAFLDDPSEDVYTWDDGEEW